MAETVSTTFSVSVGTATSLYTPSVEVDTRTAENDGYNAKVHGYTSGFKPGDKVYFIIYTGDKFSVKDVRASAGSASVKKASATVTIKDEFLNFPEGRKSTASVSKPAVQLSSTRWFGNVIGDLSVDEDRSTVRPPSLPAVNPTASASEIEAQQRPYTPPGVASVGYESRCEIWELFTPSDGEVRDALSPATTGDFPIHVSITCEEIES